MGLTYKQKFNKKYGFKKDEPHNLKEISQISDYKYSGIKIVVAGSKIVKANTALAVTSNIVSTISA